MVADDAPEKCQGVRGSTGSEVDPLPTHDGSLTFTLKPKFSENAPKLSKIIVPIQKQPKTRSIFLYTLTLADADGTVHGITLQQNDSKSQQATYATLLDMYSCDTQRAITYTMEKVPFRVWREALGEARLHFSLLAFSCGTFDSYRY